MNNIKDLIPDDKNFRQINEFGGYYYISKDGVVLSTRGRKPRVLKQYVNNSGYRHVVITHKSVCNTRLIHRFLAIAFIDNPENKMTVNHKDGNKLNNNLTNLEWATYLENNTHARKSGLCVGVKWNDQQRKKIMEAQRKWRMNNISPNAVSVRDNLTGKIYSSIKDGAKAAGYCYAHFVEMLNGTSNNKSTYAKVN